jgi:hypothetical protein
VSGLAEAGAQAGAGVATSGQSILAQNQEVEGSFAAQMQQLVTAAQSGMAQSAGDALAKLSEVGDAVTAELDRAFEEGRSSLTGTASEGKAEITGKVTRCLARMDQALADLVPAIVQRADDIENAGWWDRMVSALSGFFKGFFGALWNFIKDTLLVLLIVAAALVILVVLVVALVALFPALLGPLLAGLLFLAIHGALILTIIGYIGLAIGVVMFARSVYQCWQAWNDPSLTWAEKWEATGRTTFDAIDVIGPEKFLKWIKPLTRGAGTLDNLGDAAKVDNLGDAAKVDNLGDAAKVDDTGGATKLDDTTDATKLDDTADATKLDDTAGNSDVPYDSRAIRAELEARHGAENVTSTTVPRSGDKNVHLAGQRHEKGIVFDQRGFPIFNDSAVADLMLPASAVASGNYTGQMRAATRQLRDLLEANPAMRSQFTVTQLRAIRGGRAQIPGYTWHHHQDIGRMQLVPSGPHSKVGHIGGFEMWYGR